MAFTTPANPNYKNSERQVFPDDFPPGNKMFSASPFPMAIVNASGEILQVNAALNNYFHYWEGELIQQPISILIAEKYKELLNENFPIPEAPFQLETPKFPIIACQKNGLELKVEVTIHAFHTSSGQNGLIYIDLLKNPPHIQDKIDNQHICTSYEKQEFSFPNEKSKNKDLEYVGEEKKTTSLDDYLDLICKNVDFIILSTDKNGIIRTMNPKAVKKLGHHPDDIINKETPLLFFHNPHSSQNLASPNKKKRDYFQDWIVNMKKESRNKQEVTFIRKDKSTFTVLLTVAPILDLKNINNGYLVLAIDISKNKETEREWEKSLQKEKELNALKSSFISIASHEFRTPLSTVLSSAFLIAKYAELKEQGNIERHVDRIVNSVNLITNILNDFLSVGKIEEGKIQTRMSMFNIEQHFLKVIKELNGLLKKGQTIFYSHYGHALVTLDPILLKHILINLISNAIKFSPESSMIEISTLSTLDMIEIKIQDQGIGISEEEISHIFERFFRSENATNIQGSGLGLNIVSKYVELLNGTIHCDSILNKETTFTITFFNKKTI